MRAPRARQRGARWAKRGWRSDRWAWSGSFTGSGRGRQGQPRTRWPMRRRGGIWLRRWRQGGPRRDAARALAWRRRLEQPAGGQLGADLEALLALEPPGQVGLVDVAVGLARG